MRMLSIIHPCQPQQMHRLTQIQNKEDCGCENWKKALLTKWPFIRKGWGEWPVCWKLSVTGKKHQGNVWLVNGSWYWEKKQNKQKVAWSWQDLSKAFSEMSHLQIPARSRAICKRFLRPGHAAMALFPLGTREALGWALCPACWMALCSRWKKWGCAQHFKHPNGTEICETWCVLFCVEFNLAL